MILCVSRHMGGEMGEVVWPTSHTKNVCDGGRVALRPGRESRNLIEPTTSAKGLNISPLERNEKRMRSHGHTRAWDERPPFCCPFWHRSHLCPSFSDLDC
jgi:hypothetical protein